MILKLWNKIKYYFSLFLDYIYPARQKHPGILDEVEIARQDWYYAQNIINYADNDMLDYAIYNLDACERRFMGLLKKARNANISAWKSEELVKEVTSKH
ncbi:MAG: DUF2508 family protein [Clostridiales bacterium]|nr:DUF2508 family protein [Clostridiales bacterium]MCF8023572.1 DUF2508 family protein [Clostridiales bacterium]